MKQVDIHDAKTNLSKLVAEAAKGKPFVIAKAGKPLVKVVAIESPPSSEGRRLGFMANQVKVPDDFDHRQERDQSPVWDRTVTYSFCRLDAQDDKRRHWSGAVR
jgi:prevent-host-death family protein